MARRRLLSKFLIATILSFLLLIVYSNFVFSDCPQIIDRTNELRVQLRTVVLNYLSNPDEAALPENGEIGKNEILDLIDFYNDRADFPIIEDCNDIGEESDREIREILKEPLELGTECSDNVDNDDDGEIDLEDEGCNDDDEDDDESNCGDDICEAQEIGVCLQCPLALVEREEGTRESVERELEDIGEEIEKIISFDRGGDAVLRGKLQTKATINTTPTNTTNTTLKNKNEFIIKNSYGEPIAIINFASDTMKIAGNIYQNQSVLSPLQDNFIVKNAEGEVISYLDDSGNLYLKGKLKRSNKD